MSRFKTWFCITYTYNGKTKEYFRKANSASEAEEFFRAGKCVTDPVDQCSNITVTQV